MREMKDSGIEWIGKIPQEWNIARLCDIKAEKKYAIVDGPFGSAISTNDYKESGIPLIRITNLKNGEVTENDMVYISEELAEKVRRSSIGLSDIVFAKTGATIGKCGVNKTIKYGILASSCVKISISHEFDHRFFYYIFLTDQFNEALSNTCTGTTRDTINLSPFSKLNVVIPPYKIQHRIANYLDRKCSQIDAIIARQQEVIEKLKAYKLSVITEAVTKGLNPNVPMKDSGVEWIGEIPEHWQVPKIKYLATIASGGTPDRSHPEYWNGSINWAKTGELQNNELYETEEKITELALENSSAKVFSADTILVAMYGQGKTRGMTALLKVPSATNQACAGITVYSKDITVSYLWLFLMGAYDAIREKANGSGQPNLSGALIADFNVTLPPIEEQMNICKTVAMRLLHIDSIIKQKETIVDKLTAYKKSLIYEVVTGKKEV